MQPSRRSLITGLISLVAAPAIVRASSLMPVRGVKLPATTIISVSGGSGGGNLFDGNAWVEIGPDEVFVFEPMPRWNSGGFGRPHLFDDYLERIVGPRVNALADNVARQIMRCPNGADASSTAT